MKFSVGRRGGRTVGASHRDPWNSTILDIISSTRTLNTYSENRLILYYITLNLKT